MCIHYILANCRVLFELTKKLTLKIGFWPPSLDLRLPQDVFQNSLKASPLTMTAREENSKKKLKSKEALFPRKVTKNSISNRNYYCLHHDKKLPVIKSANEKLVKRILCLKFLLISILYGSLVKSSSGHLC